MGNKKFDFSSIVEKGREYWEDMFLEEFKNESDRGAVLISLSYIDDLLRIIIQRRLVPVNEKKQDTLFDLPNSPIGTLSSKINLSYRLGLISEEFQMVLNKLREIRNESAHSFQVFSFTEERIQKKVNSLYQRFYKLHEFEPHNFMKFGSDERGKFLIMVNWLTFKLIQSSLRIPCLKQKPLEFAFWDKELEDFFYSIPNLIDENEISEKYKSIIDKRNKNR
jgi:hypothetical protein